MKKLRFLIPLFCLGAGANAATFEVVDRLETNGYSVFKSSVDISSNSFTVGGSTLVVSYGDVGIGTADPRGEYGPTMGTPPTYLTIRGDGTAATGGGFIGLSNPAASPVDGYSAGLIGGVLSGQGSTTLSRRIGHIRIAADGATAGALGGSITFFTKQDNDNTTGVLERMRITQNGRVGISTAIPGATLDVNGTVMIRGGSPGAGKLLQSDASGLASWVNQSSLSIDNLGNHIATTTLNMNNFAISGVTTIQTYGGNARGTAAVDLQSARALATQVASGNYGAVGGGQNNTCSNVYCVVGGGSNNNVSGGYGVIAGGNNNVASGGRYNAVFSGDGNKVQADLSGLGLYGDSVIGGGANNLITNSGVLAVIPGGSENVASGMLSFAAGYKSSSTATGAFTWADSEGVGVVNNVADRTWFKNRGGFLVTGSTQPISDGGFFMTGAGRVGIGTNSPYQSALEVMAKAGDMFAVRIDSANGTNLAGFFQDGSLALTGGSLSVTRGSGDYNVLSLTNTGGVQAHFNANGNSEGNLRTVSNHKLTFSTYNTERMGISKEGDFYIGNSSAVLNGLRFFDLFNTGTGASAGSIFRLVTNNAANTTTTTVDLVKYRTGGFFINNNDTTAGTSLYTAFGLGGVERMRIDSNGWVGIGTSGPAATLSVYNSANQTSSIQVATPGTQAAQQAVLNLLTLNNGTAGQGTAGTKGWTIFARGNAYSNPAQQNDLGFSYYNGSGFSNNLFLDSEGYVGVGTANPAANLHVSSTAASSYMMIITTGTAGTTGSIGNSDVLTVSGLGQVTSIHGGTGGQFRMVRGQPAGAYNYGAFFRNDGSGTYLMLTQNGDPYGSWSAMRPFYLNNATGDVTMSSGVYLATAGGTSRVGIGLTAPFTKLDVLGTGSGTSPASSGSTDATTNLRVGRQSVGLDVGTLDDGTSYIQNRNISDFSTNYKLALNPNGGNIGIGTVNPTTALHIYRSATNPNGISGLYLRSDSTYNAAGSSTVYAAFIDPGWINATAGTPVSVGLQINSLRQTNTGDSATLAAMYGMGISYGHYKASSVSGNTTTNIGISLTPFHYNGGTITNDYGVVINAAVGTNTPTNYYAFYQADSNAKNYFAGTVLMGYERRANQHGAISGSVSCTSGKKVLGCGGLCNSGGNYMYNAYPSSETACTNYCAFANAGNTVYAMCARIAN